MSTEIAASALPLQEPFDSPQLASEQLAHPNLLCKIGELATNAIATVQEGVNNLAIYAQIKTRDVIEALDNTVVNAKSHLQQKGGKVAVHSGMTALALTGAGLGVLKESSTAHADSPAVYQIVDGPWYLHNPNDPPQIGSATIGLAQTGDTITITCHETGDNVSGDAEWDLVTDQNNGLIGLMADYGTNTPVQQGQEAGQLTALGIPECGSGTSTQENLQQAASVPVFTSYDRNSASAWAYANTEDTPPNDGSCTWFVSQALWAGGLPRTSDWNDYWYDSHGMPTAVGGSGVRQGTIDAWGAPNLSQYLSKQPYVKIESLGPMNANNNDIPDARVGDIIAYIWNPPADINSESLYDQLSHIDHLDLVTGFSQSDPEYPLVSGWSEDGGNAVHYPQRGWTWSAEHGMWLQSEPGHQNMVAYLIHIDAESDLNIMGGN